MSLSSSRVSRIILNEMAEFQGGSVCPCTGEKQFLNLRPRVRSGELELSA